MLLALGVCSPWCAGFQGTTPTQRELGSKAAQLEEVEKLSRGAALEQGARTDTDFRATPPQLAHPLPEV